ACATAPASTACSRTASNPRASPPIPSSASPPACPTPASARASPSWPAPTSSCAPRPSPPASSSSAQSSPLRPPPRLAWPALEPAPARHGRQRRPRQHLRAVRGHVHERRHNRRVPLHVPRDHMLVGVGARVMRAGLVIERVLDELESRNPVRHETQVVGAARVPDRERVHPVIVERLHPCREQRPRHVVPLQIHPPDRTRAVVHVVVPRNQLLLRQHLALRIAKMLLRIRARSQQPLLFPRPQRDPHRAPHPQAAHLQQPQRLHHRRGAGGVVGRPRPRLPGIEMPPSITSWFARSPPGISPTMLNELSPFSV